METVDLMSRRIWLRRILYFAFLLTLAVLLSACSAAKPDEDGGRAESAPGGASEHESDMNEAFLELGELIEADESDEAPAPQSSAKQSDKTYTIVISDAPPRNDTCILRYRTDTKKMRYPSLRFGQL